ncbi:MalY/PatB family protein [Actomonas aquatica]|uniref:cysteine-S-conjugate beta-lyase n=1 Tax=Actomonas aquatica TaxID=2866162 RepID=A0ABZ1C805_9BACT|nr:PatB family C-S lyase [Opitutus sp. WL0086]WRQ86430.1 PatB family C-S lyase [Opitutus sp. WL0086]
MDFTTPPQRLETDSQKWQKYAGRDIIPMWVADMDFLSSAPILEALHQRVDHGVFGYARPVPSTVDAIVKHHAEHYGWEVDPSWFVWMPGMVCGLNLCALAFSDPGDNYLTLTPVYPPFLSAGRNFDRRAVRAPWRLTDTGWELDWEAMTAALTPQTKLFYLCNPHNPIGRVWRRDELERLGAFCLEHDLLLISDEIHCDLILDDTLPHIPSSLISPELAERTITLMAPSKTYNIAGLGCTLAIISNESLRRRFQHIALGLLPEVNNLAYAACEAAYDGSSEPWRQELLTTLRGNAKLIEQTIADLPGVRLVGPQEATYLSWINVEELGLADPVAHFESHGVGLSECAFFGAKPGSYVRLNFGCPEVTLREGLRRFATGVHATRG